MIFNQKINIQNVYRLAMTEAYRMDEAECVNFLAEMATLPADRLHRISEKARHLVEEVRKKRLKAGGVDALLYQYDLSNEEGIALMCLAEALLRVPDTDTIDKLIRDKILTADWKSHAGKSNSLFVNATTWGLMLTGKVYQWNELSPETLWSSIKKLAAKGGEPMIRKSVNYAMMVLGKQFVMGRTIEDAMKRAIDFEEKGYRFSYDMLGEAARTAKDAERYFASYQNAINVIGQRAKKKGAIEGPGISIKLSALHPRYEFAKYETVVDELAPLLLKLAIQAKENNMGLTVDAEEADRLDLALDIFERVYTDPALNGWEGFGLALQSYQKRGYRQIDWLIDLARRYKRKIMVRLIKGAYWDTEIKVSQEQGFEGYPVFTRKSSTDVSYIACAKHILSAPDAIYPQFATHNAYSVATVLELTGHNKNFEFQCLHGMGQTLYDEIVGEKNLNIPCRIYAPVGTHEDLLAYLVRRLLENGANSSFVNRIVDSSAPLEDLIENPVTRTLELKHKPHPKIPLPRDIYGERRKNSWGFDLSNLLTLKQLQQDMLEASKQKWQAGPIIGGNLLCQDENPVYDPSDHRRVVGFAAEANEDQVEEALSRAENAFESWDQAGVKTRAECLQKMADLLEENQAKLMMIAVREAGKTIPDAQAEVREAVDFCRYYAALALETLDKPLELPGPTGESNQLRLSGRGPIVCISPWNFPLAIFIGQVAAALVTGNTVLAKPAEQTPLTAGFAVKLFHQAGVPGDVLQLLPGRGEIVGAKLVNDERISGVIFTGSTETARIINQSLAKRQGPIVPFIAETGGQNAMIVDSTALPEQVVRDVMISAFGSVGQRCSALRVLFVQEDIADKVITMLVGAMAEIKVGDPSLLATDIGPVIDKEAKTMLEKHFEAMKAKSKLLYQVKLSPELSHGHYFAPCAVEIENLSILTREVFGPFLHVIRYKANELDKVIDSINNTQYGLTLGVHSRIDEVVEYITKRVKVGNMYINRSMIGAVVGVQPFGGEGLSGTGPKAGGPHYLQRLCTERTVTINTTAAGGNASLMSLQE